MKDMDSLGNVRIEQQYDKFEEDTNFLYYYTRWVKEDNGFYSRNVEVYKLKDITEEDIIKLFEKEDFKLSDIFGEPITNKKETSNNIKINEEENKDYLQAIIYIKDKNDYIINLPMYRKIVYIGDTSSLATKILRTKDILDKTMENEGKIFVNGEFNKGFDPYFREEPNN